MKRGNTYREDAILHASELGAKIGIVSGVIIGLTIAHINIAGFQGAIVAAVLLALVFTLVICASMFLALFLYD
jgi:hypothetical protein